MSPSTQSAWGVIIEPGGPCNRYRWDAARGALVLERVERPNTEAQRRGADLMRLPLRASASDALPDDAAQAASEPGLLALLLAPPAHAAGVWLEARVLGAFRIVGKRGKETAQSTNALDYSEYIALAVPAADPALASVTSLATLTPELWARARQALHVVAPDAQDVSENWLDGDAIMARYRAARLAVSRQATELRRATEVPPERLTSDSEAAGDALARRWTREAAAASAQRTSQDGEESDWRGVAGLSLAELRARGAAVYGEPEDLLRWAPARFTRYLGQLLSADERALFFAAASAVKLRAWAETSPSGLRARGAVGRRPLSSWLSSRLRASRSPQRLNDGLLLVTDHQILALRDYAPADSAGIQLGFLARSWPLGRLVAVGVAPVGVSLAEALRAWPERVRAQLCAPLAFDEVTAPVEQTARLMVALAGPAGVQLTGMAFPPAATPALTQAATVLQRFTPLLGDAGHGDWRLRRIPIVSAWRPTDDEARELTSLGGIVAPGAAQALERITARALLPDEVVLAQGRTPASNRDGPEIPALLTLTSRRLLLASAPKRAEVTMRALPLETLTSVALSYSLSGSWLAVAQPRASDGLRCEQARVAFPSPLIAPFRALANRLRATLEAGIAASAPLIIE